MSYTYTGIVYLVIKLLSKNKIVFDKEALSFQIQSHPSYPSLHAITGVLDHFNIENIAAEIPSVSETLNQLPNSFIAQIKTNNNNTELVLVDKNKYGFELSTSNKQKKNYTLEAFLIVFTGVVVVIEKPNEKEKLRVSKKQFAKLLLVLTGVILLAQVVLNSPPITSVIYLFLAAVGILLSFVILKKEQGVQTTIGNVFCGAVSTKKDCDAILSSKGAKILGNFKLGDASLIFFVGLFTATIFSIIFKLDILSIVYLLSVLSIPITLYSIYYQLIIAKQWCFLCLAIVGVLWLQVGVVLYTATFLFSFTLSNILFVGFIFLVLLTIWTLIKPLIRENFALKVEKIELVKFKRNYFIFEKLLSESPILNTQIGSVNEIIFGNKLAKFEIVILTNPSCKHCKSVHKLIKNILEKYSDDVKISVRFYINLKNKKANELIITSRLLDIYMNEGSENCLLAMDDIYGGMSQKKWVKKWGHCTALEKFYTVLKVHNAWCLNQEINFTPEILLNGQSFPKAYKKEDLLFFIEDLIETN